MYESRVLMQVKIISFELLVMALLIQEKLEPFLASETPETESQALGKKPKTAQQKVMRKTFKGTANVTKLLPTGAVLAFQLISPILTHQGKCHTLVSQYLTISLITLCGLSCFLLCFTDSFRDEKGKVRYGIATFSGLFVMDQTVEISAEEALKYKIKFLDVLHGLMTMLVFASVSLFDQNVFKCFFPNSSDKLKDLLGGVSIGVTLICAILFVYFPTKRHGIGYPLSRN